jgi:Tol biopolymer transport system component
VEDVIDYHFSPDGTLMVYEQVGVLFILDMLSGNTSVLTIGGLEPATPQFSPNGLQLSYQSRDRDAGVDGIHVADLGVDPDTGDLLIVRESRVASERHRKTGAGGDYITSGPYWSPTGNYLAYGVQTWAGYKRAQTVMRIAADGSNPTSLAPYDGDVPLLIARGWRQ